MNNDYYTVEVYEPRSKQWWPFNSLYADAALAQTNCFNAGTAFEGKAAIRPMAEARRGEFWPVEN